MGNKKLSKFEKMKKKFSYYEGQQNKRDKKYQKLAKIHQERLEKEAQKLKEGQEPFLAKLEKYLREKIKDSNIYSVFCKFTDHTIIGSYGSNPGPIVANLYFGRQQRGQLDKQKMICLYQFQANLYQYDETIKFEDLSMQKEMVSICETIGFKQKDIDLMLEISKAINTDFSLCFALEGVEYSLIYPQEERLKNIANPNCHEEFKKIKL